MKRLLVTLLVGCLPLLAAGPTAPTGGTTQEWQAQVPSFAQKTEEWAELTRKLTEHNMPYGALASSYRMLEFFNDLALKEQAYRTIIRIVDLGYPFSTQTAFVTGDIEPKPDAERGENYDFSNSYYLYKAIGALDKGVKKWADSYLASVDTENFIKYAFWQAIEAYKKKDMKEAEKWLQKVLSRKVQDRYQSLFKKAARTLARIYFEQEQYGRSYDIYRSFLLRLNPLEPSDWVEAAWDLYYLKRYDEALGMIFNMESLVSGEMIQLEKYVLRALIYEELCATDYMERLVSTFEKEFGAAIMGVKTGKVLSKIPELQRIYVAENEPYYQLTTTLANLQEEQARLGRLPSGLRDLARYLYETEISVIQKRMPAYAEEAGQRAADQLVGFAEALRFIKFDVAKSRLGSEEEQQSTATKKKEDEFEIRWVQNGDFWRDERLRYHAVLENRCLQ